MHKGRILIVDDQEEILASLEAALGDEGYETIIARDGQEALHIAQNEALDMVFLDVWIPGIDGMQTLRAMKRMDPDRPVVMMSGHGAIETAVKAIKLGATDYLEKPLNLDDIIRLVEQADRAGDRSRNRMELSPSLLIGGSEMAENMRRQLESAAKGGDSVWFWGEKGSGKEFAARILHSLGGGSRDTLIKVRLSDLKESAIEETLLGKHNGSGPIGKGKIYRAAGGGLLLSGIDRITESALESLANVLGRFLNYDDKKTAPLLFDGRIIVTSNLDPEILIQNAPKNIQPLLNVLAKDSIRVPSLIERIEDLPFFIDHFLKEASLEFDREILSVDPMAVERMKRYSWPGNVKELKILMEHVVMTANGPTITVSDLMIPELDGALSKETTEEHSSPIAEQTIIESVDSNDLNNNREGWKEPGTVQIRTRVDRPQKTLNGKVVMYGQGLHTGAKTGLIISPLPVNSGIVFGHINSEDTVEAQLDNVISTEMATSLRGAHCSAGTVEHLLAVFNVYGLDNLLVKISGEVPIMDGSAVEFCKLVENAQTISQGEASEEIIIKEPIELELPQDSPKQMTLEPSDVFEIEYFMDYPKPIGKLHMSFTCDDPRKFKEEIAPARTFGFVKDVKMMDEMGLAGGGRLSNLVLLDDEKVVNPPLRYPDEFVRHKILDIIGDFYLLGRPIRAKVIAKQTGHSENISMLKLLAEKLRLGQ